MGNGDRDANKKENPRENQVFSRLNGRLFL